MGERTGISWCDSTWNCVRGCSRVSEGCRNCYAESVAARFCGPGQAYEGLADRARKGSKWTGVVRMVPEHLADPLRWKRPRRIFVNSMSDLFHESLTNEQITAVFGVMAAAPQHSFQVLTKRSRRMREWFEWVCSGGRASRGDTLGYLNSRAREAMPQHHRGYVIAKLGHDWPLPNVWIGVSVEDQEAADVRIPDLLETPAAVRFLSCEPLLGPVNLRGVAGEPTDDEAVRIDALDGTWRTSPRDDDGHPVGARIGWVIVGSESGPRARPCETKWIRWLRDQCTDARVPFFFKQAVADGRPGEYEAHLKKSIDEGDGSHRKGRGFGGPVIELPYLDGVQWAQFPEESHAT